MDYDAKLLGKGAGELKSEQKNRRVPGWRREEGNQAPAGTRLVGQEAEERTRRVEGSVRSVPRYMGRPTVTDNSIARRNTSRRT